VEYGFTADFELGDIQSHPGRQDAIKAITLAMRDAL